MYFYRLLNHSTIEPDGNENSESTSDETTLHSEFDILDLKMERTLEGLNLINQMLSNPQQKNPIRHIPDKVEKEQLKKLEDQCLALNLQLIDISKQSEDRQNTIDQIQEQKENLHHRLRTLQEKLNKEVKVYHEKLNLSQQELDKTTQALDKKTQEFDQQAQELNKKSQELDQQAQELNKKSQEFDQQAQELNKKSQELDKITQEFDKKNQEVNKKRQDYLDLEKSKASIETKLQELESRLAKEVERKEQVEVQLKENAIELKIIRKAVSDRDEKLDQYQQNLLSIQHMMDEKDDLLEAYVKEAQINSKEVNQLLDKINQLEKENDILKKQLDNPPPHIPASKAPTENRRYSTLDEPSFSSHYNHLNSNSIGDHPSPYSTKLDSSKIPTHNYNSRIPVPTHSHRSSIQPDQSSEIKKLKEEIFIYQQRLMEKTCQNKELESAMERVEEHCKLLRASLNKSEEESANRYRKMLDLMEENRILKEELSNNKDIL